MSTHTHPAAIRETGLQDGCDRCAEHAQNPFAGLDDDNLGALIVRTRLWINDDPEGMPRSENELQAMRIVETAIRQARAIARVEATHLHSVGS